jgi:hypothetical protein
VISNDVELYMQRLNTDAFIKAWPEVLVLNRVLHVSDGQGGFSTTTLPPLAAQTFAVLPQNHQLQDRITIDGQTVTPDYKLLGYYNADIQRGDWFLWRGNRYDVVYVYGNRDYETLAEVLYRG